MTALSLLLALSACNPVDAEDRHALTGPDASRLVSSVEIEPSGAILEPDGLGQFTAVVKSARGRTVSRNVAWAVADEDVIQIDGSGNVVGLNEGTTMLRATHEGVTGDVSVDVRGEVVSLRLDRESVELAEGAATQLTATYVYANGAERQVAAPLEWRSADPTILGVNSDGLTWGAGNGETRVHVRGRGHEVVVDGRVLPTTVRRVEVGAPTNTLEVGEEARFWADVLDDHGNRVFRLIQWSSSNNSVAVVSGNGVVTARAEGKATIRAEAESVTGSLTIEVVSVGSQVGGGSDGSARESRPGTVTNLRVVSTSRNSATLRFTEVDDGEGRPAKYEVRYDRAPLGWGWGSAARVRSGSCETPLRGKGIGSTLTCTVEGLQAGTGYDFQLVPYRGTLNQDAVFGPLSDIASGTTEDVPIQVEVLPTGATLEVGQSRQLRASVTDAYGNPLDRSVSWSSTRTSVATVSGSGTRVTVTARNVGDTEVRATASGVTGISKIRVIQPEPVGGGDDSGLPSGYRWVTQNPWNQLTGNGWTESWNDKGNARIVRDQSAPQSCCNVLEHRYQKGFTGGAAPGTLNYSLGSSRGVYISTWWKANSGWQRHSAGDKLLFVFPADNKEWYLIWRGGSLMVRSATPVMLASNVNSKSLQAGRWYHIEWLIEHEGGQYWTVKWWVDGTLRGSHQRVPAASDPLAVVKISPTWGGVGETKQQDDYFRWDYTSIAIKD